MIIILVLKQLMDALLPTKAKHFIKKYSDMDSSEFVKLVCKIGEWNGCDLTDDEVEELKELLQNPNKK